MAIVIRPGNTIKLLSTLTPLGPSDTTVLTDPIYGLGGLRTVDYINIDAIPDWDGTDTGVDYARNDRVESTITVGTYYILSVNNLVADAANLDPENDITNSWTLLLADDLSALSLRDSIPLSRQQLGTIVYAEVANGAEGADKFYKLISLSRNVTTPLSDGDWEELLVSDMVTLSSTANFGGLTTVQEALDSLSSDIAGIDPSGFQGDWDPDTQPIPLPASGTTYNDGDFWRVMLPAGMTVDNVLGMGIQDRDLVYYREGTVTGITLDDDFFLVRTSQLDLTAFVNSIAAAAGGTFDYNNQGGTGGNIVVVTEEGTGTPSVSIGVANRELSTSTSQIPISDRSNFPHDTTIQDALDDLAVRVSAINPGTFQGSWDAIGEPTVTLPMANDPYVDGDFWRVTLAQGVTVNTGLGDVVDGDLVYYRGDNDPLTTSLTADFFLVKTSGDTRADISALINSITQQDNGTFQYTTHSSSNPQTVRVVQGSNSILLGSSATLTTAGNIIPVGDDIQTGSNTVIASGTDVSNGLNTLNTKIDTVDTALDPLVDSITQNDDGTFSYSTHGSTADTSVRVVQGSTSISLDTADASLSTAANQITLGQNLSKTEGLITGAGTPNNLTTTNNITIYQAIDDLNDVDSEDILIGGTAGIITPGTGGGADIEVLDESATIKEGLQFLHDETLALDADDIAVTSAHFPADHTVEEAIDDLDARLNAISPSTFQGTWDPDTENFPVLTEGTAYIQGDFWRIEFSGVFTSGTIAIGSDPAVPIRNGDLIYYNGTLAPATVTDFDDFFVLEQGTTTGGGFHTLLAQLGAWRDLNDPQVDNPEGATATYLEPNTHFAIENPADSAQLTARVRLEMDGSETQEFYWQKSDAIRGNFQSVTATITGSFDGGAVAASDIPTDGQVELYRISIKTEEDWQNGEEVIFTNIGNTGYDASSVTFDPAGKRIDLKIIVNTGLDINFPITGDADVTLERDVDGDVSTVVLELDRISDTTDSEDLFEFAFNQVMSPGAAIDPNFESIRNNIFYNFSYDGLHDVFFISKAPFNNPDVTFQGGDFSSEGIAYRAGDISRFPPTSAVAPIFYRAQADIPAGDSTNRSPLPDATGAQWNQLGAVFSTTTNYTAGDIVLHNSVDYTAIEDIPASTDTPTDDPNNVWAQREGTYDNIIDYRIGDIVTFNSANWIAIEDINQIWNTEQDYVVGDVVGFNSLYYEALTATLPAFQWDIDTASYAVDTIVFDNDQWFESNEVITAPLIGWDINTDYVAGTRLEFPANDGTYYVSSADTIVHPDYLFRQDYIFDSNNPTIVNYPETAGGDNRYFVLEEDFIFPDDWDPTTDYPVFSFGSNRPLFRSNDPLGTGVLTLDDFNALQTGSTITITDGTTPITVTAAAVAGPNEFIIGQDNADTANNIATAFNDAFYTASLNIFIGVSENSTTPGDYDLSFDSREDTYTTISTNEPTAFRGTGTVTVTYIADDPESDRFWRVAAYIITGPTNTNSTFDFIFPDPAAGVRPQDSNQANALWDDIIVPDEIFATLPMWDANTEYTLGQDVIYDDVGGLGVRVWNALGTVPIGTLNPPDHLRTLAWEERSILPDSNQQITWESYDVRPNVDDDQIWDMYQSAPADDSRWDEIPRPAMGDPSTDPQGPHGEDLWSDVIPRPVIENPEQQENIQWARTIIDGYDPSEFFAYLGTDPNDSDSRDPDTGENTSDDRVTLLQSVDGTDGTSESQVLSIDWPTTDPRVPTTIRSSNAFTQDTPLDTVVRDFLEKFNDYDNLFADIEIALDENGATLIDLDNGVTDPGALLTTTGESYTIKLRDRARGCHEDASDLEIISGTLGDGDIAVSVDQDTLRLSADLIAGDLHVCGQKIRPVDPNTTLEIKGLIEPEENDDAATKAYVDNSPKPATDQIVRFTFSGVSERVESFWTMTLPPDPPTTPSSSGSFQGRGSLRVRGLVGSRFDGSDLFVTGDEFQIHTVGEDEVIGPGYDSVGGSASIPGRTIFIGEESTFGEPDPFGQGIGTINELVSTLNSSLSYESASDPNATQSDFLGIQFVYPDGTLGNDVSNADDDNSPSNNPDTLFEGSLETQFRFHAYNRAIDFGGYTGLEQRSIYRYEAIEPAFETTQIRINGTNASELEGWTITLGVTEFEQSATFVFRENSDDDVDSALSILTNSLSTSTAIAIAAASAIESYLYNGTDDMFSVQRGSDGDSNLLTITHTGGGNIENAARGRVDVNSPTRLIVDRINNIEAGDTIVFTNVPDGDVTLTAGTDFTIGSTSLITAGNISSAINSSSVPDLATSFTEDLNNADAYIIDVLSRNDNYTAVSVTVINPTSLVVSTGATFAYLSQSNDDLNIVSNTDGDGLSMRLVVLDTDLNLDTLSPPTIEYVTGYDVPAERQITVSNNLTTESENLTSIKFNFSNLIERAQADSVNELEVNILTESTAVEVAEQVAAALIETDIFDGDILYTPLNDYFEIAYRIDPDTSVTNGTDVLDNIMTLSPVDGNLSVDTTSEQIGTVAISSIVYWDPEAEYKNGDMIRIEDEDPNNRTVYTFRLIARTNQDVSVDSSGNVIVRINISPFADGQTIWERIFFSGIKTVDLDVNVGTIVVEFSSNSSNPTQNLNVDPAIIVLEDDVEKLVINLNNDTYPNEVIVRFGDPEIEFNRELDIEFVNPNGFTAGNVELDYTRFPVNTTYLIPGLTNPNLTAAADSTVSSKFLFVSTATNLYITEIQRNTSENEVSQDDQLVSQAYVDRANEIQDARTPTLRIERRTAMGTQDTREFALFSGAQSTIFDVISGDGGTFADTSTFDIERGINGEMFDNFLGITNLDLDSPTVASFNYDVPNIINLTTMTINYRVSSQLIDEAGIATSAIDTTEDEIITFNNARFEPEVTGGTLDQSIFQTIPHDFVLNVGSIDQTDISDGLAYSTDTYSVTPSTISGRSFSDAVEDVPLGPFEVDTDVEFIIQIATDDTRNPNKQPVIPITIPHTVTVTTPFFWGLGTIPNGPIDFNSQSAFETAEWNTINENIEDAENGTPINITGDSTDIGQPITFAALVDPTETELVFRSDTFHFTFSSVGNPVITVPIGANASGRELTYKVFSGGADFLRNITLTLLEIN